MLHNVDFTSIKQIEAGARWTESRASFMLRTWPTLNPTPTPVKQIFFIAFFINRYLIVWNSNFLHFQTPFSGHLPTHHLGSPRSIEPPKIRPLSLWHPHPSMLQTSRDRLSVVIAWIFPETKPQTVSACAVSDHWMSWGYNLYLGQSHCCKGSGFLPSGGGSPCLCRGHWGLMGASASDADFFLEAWCWALDLPVFKGALAVWEKQKPKAKCSSDTLQWFWLRKGDKWSRTLWSQTAHSFSHLEKLTVSRALAQHQWITSAPHRPGMVRHAWNPST